MAAAADDEKLSELLSKHGAEGYGIYWLILEKIADKMEKGSDKTCCKYSAKKWAEICGKNPRGMRKIFETFEYLSLFIFIRYGKHMDIISNSYAYESDNNCISYEYYINIDCPNLLKYRDEYTKKSGECPDCIQTDSGQTPEQETETDIDTELNNTALGNAVSNEEFYLTKKKRKLSGKRLETFNLFWEAFNYRKGKAEAADSWLDIPMLTDRLVSEIYDAARKEAAKRPELITQGRTPKMAQGWLTARRWEDEITQPKGDDGSQKALALRSKTEQLLKEMGI